MRLMIATLVAAFLAIVDFDRYHGQLVWKSRINCVLLKLEQDFLRWPDQR
jgi:hypothetical protein